MYEVKTDFTYLTGGEVVRKEVEKVEVGVHQNDIGQGHGRDLDQEVVLDTGKIYSVLLSLWHNI